MKHYLVTNRRIDRRPDGSEFIISNGKEIASREIRFATFDITNRTIELLPDLPVPVSYAAPEENTTKAGSSGFFTELYNDMCKSGKDVLFFIHGYNCDLECTLENILLLHKNYVLQHPGSNIGHIVVYTWPSNGRLLEYRSDWHDAQDAGFTLARAYLKLQRFFKEFFGRMPNGNRLNQPCGNNIHLMCHSLGVKVLQEMLAMLLTEDYGVTTLFKEVILTAADLDINALEKPNPLFHITRLCERVHVYYNTTDMALAVSETTKNSLNRLGKYGPANVWNIPQHVNIVDVSEAPVDGNPLRNLREKVLGHWYHNYAESVIQDMRSVLAGVHTEQIQGREFLVHKGVFRVG